MRHKAVLAVAVVVGSILVIVLIIFGVLRTHPAHREMHEHPVGEMHEHAVEPALAHEPPHEGEEISLSGTVVDGVQVSKSAEELTFGPVIEQVLRDADRRGGCFIDLDTGQVLSVPADASMRAEPTADDKLTWVREHGLDAGQILAGTMVLAGVDLIAVPLTPERWHSTDAGFLFRDEALALATPSALTALAQGAELPATYFFKTREGGTGILQIVAFTEDPPGVKIRYKMVQSPRTGAGGVPEEAREIYDWQRLDEYVPPNFEGFFPDDPEGGRRLDAMFEDPTRGRLLPDEEVLRIVRNGLRRTSKNRSVILSNLGTRFIWGVEVQNPDAIEIMYHAADHTDNDTRYNAVYYGLSVAEHKTPNILRALVDICMKGQDVGRIIWGCRSQFDEMRGYLRPYLEDENGDVRELASVLDKHFKGEADYDKWKAGKEEKRALAEYGGRLPYFRRTLKTGTTAARESVFADIDRGRLWRILDDSFLEAFAQCARDPDPGVRSKVASIVGTRWIWRTTAQNPQAIALMLELSKDPDPAARHNAIYYGLSVVRPMSDEVIWRLVDLAMEQYDDRIAWGLRTERDRIAPFLSGYLDKYETDPDTALRAYLLFREVTGHSPPDAQRFADLGTFVIEFRPKSLSRPWTEKALLTEFRELLPDDARVSHVNAKWIHGYLHGSAIVDGAANLETISQALGASRSLRSSRSPLLATTAAGKERTNSRHLIAPSYVSYEQALVDLHSTLGRYYPCFELKGIDWEAVGRELLPRAKEMETDEGFGLLCMELVARLEDSHAQVRPGTAKLPALPLPKWDPGFACLIDDLQRPVVYYVDKDGPAEQAGVRVGMTVLSIDGTPAATAIEQCMKRRSKYIGYSSQRYLEYHAVRFFVRQMERGTMVSLTMEDPSGQGHSFRLPATLGVRYLPRLPVPIQGVSDSANVSWTMLDGKIGYIYVRRIRGDLIESLDGAVAELGHAKGVIIDVRGNSGGGFDAGRAYRNFALDDEEEPQRPRFKGPMALLIDERCISAGEGWASWFVANQRARVFGAATAGASSRKRTYLVKGGLYKVKFPIKAYRGFLDRPIERRGLEPDVPLRQNARDLAAGRDTVLQAARAYLLGVASREASTYRFPIPYYQPKSRSL